MAKIIQFPKEDKKKKPLYASLPKKDKPKDDDWPSAQESLEYYRAEKKKRRRREELAETVGYTLLFIIPIAIMIIIDQV